ncbi:c-type cytochrome [Paenibacillus sp. LMG 31456]|uniref:C-type cytochrome n=1 Tax=Paenibacillus foliorum TaxID=2654974 RepID=A0A972GPC4_9BACL|nr:cytochrome c [Paenibacillus foliorum]NOU94436.1 c-type cytochrome [Paenibacillus foliorum]
MVKQWMRVLAGCIVIAGMTACGSTHGSVNESTQNNKQAAANTLSGATDAETLYKSSCIACHGANLEGKAGPSLQKIGSKLGKEQIVTKIQNGGGGMPSYDGKLKDKEIQLLSEWLSAKK